MEMDRNLLRRIAPVVLVLLVLWGLSSLFGASPSAEPVRRPDVIRIDAVARLKPLEMPPAVFLHDAHTKALAAQGKDCTVCHTPGSQGQPFAFQRAEGAQDAQKMEQLFHKGCIGCHADLAGKDQPTGPQDGECRLCHATAEAYVGERVPVRMGDRSLHYLHVSSKAIVYRDANGQINPDGENCGACHHVYDESAKKLVWKKGAEDACAACHAQEAQGNTPSLQTAMHDTCVQCHVRVAAGQPGKADPSAAPAPDKDKKKSKKERKAEERARKAAEREAREHKGKDAPAKPLPQPIEEGREPGLKHDGERPEHDPSMKLQRIAYDPSNPLRLAPGQIPSPEMLRQQPDVPSINEAAPSILPPAEKPARNNAEVPAAPDAPAVSTAQPSASAPAASADSPATATEPVKELVKEPAQAQVEPVKPVQPAQPESAPAKAVGQPAAEDKMAAAAAEEKLGELIRVAMAQEAARRMEAAQQAAAIEAEIVSGPSTCAGCHTESAQAAYHKVNNPPRLMRGQPDATIILPPPAAPFEKGENGDKRVVAAGMPPVLFNHKGHEEVVDSCRVCHHKRISSCTDCHTVEGVKEGKFVTLAEAMHTSCVGCHQERVMQKPECAGCHASLPQPMEIKSTCAVCHQKVEGISQMQVTDGTAFGLGKARLEEIAEANMATRLLNDMMAAGKTGGTDAPSSVVDAMPEKVVIGSLSNEFEPSVMPHRQIFRALQKGMDGDGLASAFHTDDLATCAACHHHSPVAELAAPPKCASCHGSQADKMMVDNNRPSLKAAYHQQCMVCHERMNIARPAATDCAGCHAAKPATSGERTARKGE